MHCPRKLTDRGANAPSPGPLTSFLYERGWRQNFKTAGFPGVDLEFEELKDFLKEVEGGTVVDLSCGSGLMTRRLVSEGPC